MTKQNVRVPDAAGSVLGVSTVVIPNTALFTPGTVTSPGRCIPVSRRNFRLMTKKLETAQKINAWVDSMRASSPTSHVRAATPTRSSHHQQQQQQQNNKNSWMSHHPSALEKFEKIMNESKGKQIVIFLDYDGTLSPIVDDPERAFMSDEMRGAVRDVAKHFPTAIVTGRCKDKVYDFVRLAELYYAGSHGMDIQGPVRGVEKDTVLFQPASEFIPMIDEVYKILWNKTRSTPGAIVENNKFCLSVHFRCVDEKRWAELADQVKDVLKNYPNLRLTQGRKVLEIRPSIKWDKGKALEFLLESLGYSQSSDVFPIYVGDDRTDEDAFKVLRQRNQGFGILVSTVPKETNASYTLQEPSEVKSFLQRLVEWQSKRLH